MVSHVLYLFKWCCSTVPALSSWEVSYSRYSSSGVSCFLCSGSQQPSTPPPLTCWIGSSKMFPFLQPVCWGHYCVYPLSVSVLCTVGFCSANRTSKIIKRSASTELYLLQHEHRGPTWSTGWALEWKPACRRGNRMLNAPECRKHTPGLPMSGRAPRLLPGWSLAAVQVWFS